MRVVVDARADALPRLPLRQPVHGEAVVRVFVEEEVLRPPVGGHAVRPRLRRLHHGGVGEQFGQGRRERLPPPVEVVLLGEQLPGLLHEPVEGRSGPCRSDHVLHLRRARRPVCCECAPIPRDSQARDRGAAAEVPACRIGATRRPFRTCAAAPLMYPHGAADAPRKEEQWGAAATALGSGSTREVFPTTASWRSRRPPRLRGSQRLRSATGRRRRIWRAGRSPPPSPCRRAAFA